MTETPVVVAVVATIISVALMVFFVMMWARFVLDWVRVLNPAWRPRGLVLVLAEATFTVTDPPIKLVRRVIPPLTLGSFRFDFAWSIVLLVCLVLIYIVGAFR